MSDRIKSFEEFWPFYVREHSNKSTRVLHFIGTTAAVTTLGAALATRKASLIPLALVAGYGPAWISHFFIQKNRPASFKYPLWSLLGDFKMLGKMAKGTMDAEVERCMAEVHETVVEAVNQDAAHRPPMDATIN